MWEYTLQIENRVNKRISATENDMHVKVRTSIYIYPTDFLIWNINLGKHIATLIFVYSLLLLFKLV